MKMIRHWVVRHARAFEWLYQRFEPVLVKLAPVYRKLGYQRMEKPVALIERSVKGLLFDCQMCGHCVLSQTGMACPMNCPKQLRNGPCGGVRANGHCEVKPDMRCVWVEAYEGSLRMRGGDLINVVQAPVDASLKNSSSWLSVAREKTEGSSPHEV